ncbi:PKD domain-containing protein [[Eubacterium] cellulosolvens]
MRKSILAILIVFLMLASMLVITTNVSACHNMSATCSPTEKDIVDFNTWSTTYTIDVKLTPGCGNQYWVGFTAGTPTHGAFHRKMYKEGDGTKTNIIGPGSGPSDANHNNWAGWISAGSGGEVHYRAVLEVWCNQQTPNGQSAVVTVDVWSCDNVPNDLEHRVVTTTTTVNIPKGIFFEHSVPFKATQYVQPDKWALFDITITNIGEAGGQIDLTKGPMSSDCLDQDWEYVLPATADLPTFDMGNVEFQAKVKPPANADEDDFAILIIKGVNHDNSSFYHTITAKTIVSKPKPDLSVRADTGIDNIRVLTDDPCANDVFNISLDVYNLGDIPVSNFEVAFRLSTLNQEALIGTITVEETLNPDEFINVQHPWTALEGVHSLCVHLDENNLIREKDDESNNEAGLLVDVGSARPKSIILTMELQPSNCMPETEFTVSGNAKYNPEFGSAPVKDTSVKIRIKETNTIFETKTNSKGDYSKICTAPKDPDSYLIEVTVNDGNIKATKTEYLTVALFQVTLVVSPTTIITGDSAVVSGMVSEENNNVPDVDITIKLFDESDIERLSVQSKTDTYGYYSKEITPPTVTKYSWFKVDVTATKNEISGTRDSKLFVDIDTDNDLIGNVVDSDDDGDGYPDTLEDDHGYDSLDASDVPYPVADAGPDQTIDEGGEVSFNSVNSYSPVGLPLAYEWDFGDSSDSSDKTAPKHTYNKNDEYTVTLTVRDEYGGVDTATATVTVNDLGPVAKLTGPATGETGTTLQFSAEESTSAPDKIKKYEWDWDGDGTYDMETDSATIGHAWIKADTYTVILQITDTDGSTSMDSIPVIITAKPVIEPDGDGSGSSKTSGDNTMLLVVAAVVIIAVILIALFMLMRRKKPTAVRPNDQRVSNIHAQQSRRPTTQFAEAEIKPAMSAPGTIPKQQMSTPVQQTSALPPPQKLAPVTPPPQQEQRDWNWNFNE